MHGLLQLGLVAFLGIANSPFPKDVPTAIPYLKWELEPLSGPLFVSGTISARCNPFLFNRWNPQTALWEIRGGVHLGEIDLSIGHVSEHGVDKIVRFTESRDFVELSLKKEF